MKVGNKMILLLIVAIILIFISVGCGGKEDSQPISIDYEIINKNDHSMPKAKRYSLDVVVKEKVTEEELKNLAEKIVEDMKKEDKFNAISLGFYDYKEYVGIGYTLGGVDYAPNGKWGDAGTVSTGQYNKMEYNYNVQEKDWDKQLTKEEVLIFKEAHDNYHNRIIENPDIEEDDAYKEVAEKYNMTLEEVKDILYKQVDWIFNNKSE